MFTYTLILLRISNTGRAIDKIWNTAHCKYDFEHYLFHIPMHMVIPHPQAGAKFVNQEHRSTANYITYPKHI